MFGVGRTLRLECESWVGKNSQGMFDYSPSHLNEFVISTL